MRAAQVRLAVDCGSVATVGVLAWPDGSWLPLLFDGQPWLPSALYVAADGAIVTGEAAWRAATVDAQGFEPNPLRHQPGARPVLSGVDVPVMDLVAATLRRVAEEAARVAGGPVGDVRLVVPAEWGPRRTTGLRQAAHRAGLGEATVVLAPVAVARQVAATGLELPVGAYVAVCDVGGGAEATVLRRGPTGFELLSTLHEDTGGTRLDALLACHWTGTDVDGQPGPAPGVIVAARAAKEVLSQRATVTVSFPAPDPPRVVSAADLHAVAVPVLQRAATLVVEAVAAAELSLPDVGVVIVTGGTARLPLTTEAVAAAVAGPPVVADDPVLASARGAADAYGARIDTAPSGGDLGPPVPPLRRAFTLAVPGIASLALLFDFLAVKNRAGGRIGSVYRYLNYEPGVRGFGPGDFVVKVNWGELAMAAVLALVACLCLAVNFGSVLPVNAGLNRPHGLDGTRMGAGLLAATVSGLVIAGFYAVFAAEYIMGPTGPFLRWTVPPLLPAAVTVVLAAAAIAGWKRRPAAGWHAWLHFPASSALTAALGMILVNWSHWYTFAGEGVLVDALPRVGGFVVGVAAALAVVRPWRYRLVIALPIGALTSVITSADSTGALGGIYITAVTIWWLQRLWQITYQPPPAWQTP
jgi:hypothetical protein